MEFVDIAGLVKGASKGEGLGNKFLANIREVDAIAHVVRCFEDPNVIHVANKVDPKEDIEVIEAELMLADLDAIEKRLYKAEKMTKTGDKKALEEVEFMRRLKDMLAKGEPIRRASHSDEETLWLKSYALLSSKPVLYVANVSEDMVDKPNPHVDAVKKIAAEEGARVVVISGQVEGEIAQLPLEERKEYLAGMGLKESGLDRMIRAGYELLGLITYLTAGEKEVRAWTITKGTKAPAGSRQDPFGFRKRFYPRRGVPLRRPDEVQDRTGGQGGRTAPLRRQGICGQGRRHHELPVQRVTIRFIKHHEERRGAETPPFFY